jgi:hypothetical protein
MFFILVPSAGEESLSHPDGMPQDLASDAFSRIGPLRSPGPIRLFILDVIPPQSCILKSMT